MERVRDRVHALELCRVDAAIDRELKEYRAASNLSREAPSSMKGMERIEESMAARARSLSLVWMPPSTYI